MSHTGFDPARYGPEVERLLVPRRVAELGPGQPNRQVRPLLKAISAETLFPQTPCDRDMAAACCAGLWLYHDFLDESHRISQELHTPEGSYWHAIMHRREPDFSNSKYWFRQVGRHPVFTPLEQSVRQLAEESGDALATELAEQAAWDPFRFVDLCQAALAGRGHEALCREIQAREWELLFDYCWEEGLGSRS